MREFKINKYITLRLERGRTNIYVNGKLFNHCKYVLLDIPLENAADFDQIESIDDAVETLDHSMEKRRTRLQMDPEAEFWGHSSNLMRRRKLYNIFSKEPRIQTASGNHADSNPKGLGSKACMVMY